MRREGRQKFRPCFRERLLPGLPGRSSEVERQELKFLQLNLGRGKDAQDLLLQTERERGADVLLISEQYKWSDNSVCYQDASRGAASLFLTLNWASGTSWRPKRGSFG